ncbi:MAG: SPASM domain-containing protein [Candidatus Omnitrophica bacterium]|nr:SPASM domain-containing protein [Candidatus Omnitrophota bacterium]
MIPENNDMRFEVTTRCNYNCIICPREKITRKIETMDLELFKYLFDKIISETSQYTTLTFPGMGEPLLDESLEKKIEYAKNKSKSIEILLLSNGSLLTPERFLELERIGLSSVRVSFYADKAQKYMDVHGVKNKDMFNRVRDNLLAISRIKQKTKLLLTFNIVDGGNDESTKNWIDFWQPRVDLLEVWRPHNWVDARTYRAVQKDKIKTCGRPLKGPLQVQVDGTVNMCCFDFDGKLTLGDLKTQSLAEIFSSAMYRKIVSHHEKGDFKDSGLICENCDLRNKDKSDVMVYNSKFDIKERVNMISTTYSKLT